jgi:hypothetical protein
MPRAMKVCPVRGCTEVTTAGRCAPHRAQADRIRGSRHARGYGAAHDRLRAQWAPRVAAGAVRCWRCDELLVPGQPWDLGHDDHDRAVYRGPEHPGCNRKAGGASAHALGGGPPSP